VQLAFFDLEQGIRENWVVITNNNSHPEMPPNSHPEMPPMNAEDQSEGDLSLALGSVAVRAGEQAGAALLIVELLASNRVISISDVKKLVRLLASDSPEAQRLVIAQYVVRRKAKPNRLSRTSIRRS
jgi:hypothetical protein